MAEELVSGRSGSTGRVTTQIILILVAAKIFIVTVVSIIVWRVIGPEWKAQRRHYGMPGVRCIYCRATPALFHSEEQKWEGDELVLVRTYECRECHMPFWKVERVAAERDKTRR